MVERFHFTPEIESLQSGYTGGSPLPDLTYTLHAFPNHPRALDAVSRYAIRGGKISPEARIQSFDCYFLRGIAFRPDDEAVRVIYANYLFKTGEQEKAREQYEEALRLAPESVEINYVAGLYFVSVGDLARAKKLAEVAYGKGYPLPGLKKKIAAAEAQADRQANR
jgi:tetratricopeptide (TPR) repeat protein